MTNLDVFRPRSSVFAAAVSYIFIFILCFQTITTSNLHGIFVACSWGIFAANLVYLILHRPKIEFFDEGIRITNPFDQITVGWHRVESIEAKYTMSILVGGKSIYAWAAPAPGRYHARSVHPSEIKGMEIGVGGLIRPGESPRTHSGTASYLASQRLKDFTISNRDTGCESKISVNYFGILILTSSLLIGIALNVYHF